MSAFIIPVAVVGDPEALALTIIDKVTIQQYLELPVGADLPIIDSRRERILCVHKHGNAFDVNEAHVVAELDEHWQDKNPIFDPVGKLSDEELNALAEAGPCLHDTSAAPVEGRYDARRRATQKADRRRRAY